MHANTEINITPDMFLEKPTETSVIWGCGCGAENSCAIKLVTTPQQIKCVECGIIVNVTINKLCL